MIFLHLILGLICGKLFGNTWFFVGASMLPDIDHLYLIIKHHLFPLKKTITILKKEEEHNIHFKTPVMHSLLGLILCTLIFFVITTSTQFTFYFFLMYTSHLLLDWPDIDRKMYLYPLKKEFRGRVPIWSNGEKVITALSILILILLYV